MNTSDYLVHSEGVGTVARIVPYWDRIAFSCPSLTKAFNQCRACRTADNN